MEEVKVDGSSGRDMNAWYYPAARFRICPVFPAEGDCVLWNNDDLGPMWLECIKDIISASYWVLCFFPPSIFKVHTAHCVNEVNTKYYVLCIWQQYPAGEEPTCVTPNTIFDSHSVWLPLLLGMQKVCMGTGRVLLTLVFSQMKRWISTRWMNWSEFRIFPGTWIFWFNLCITCPSLYFSFHFIYFRLKNKSRTSTDLTETNIIRAIFHFKCSCIHHNHITWRWVAVM